MSKRSRKGKKANRDDLDRLSERVSMQLRRTPPEQEYLDKLWWERRFDELEREFKRLETIAEDRTRHRLEQDVYRMSQEIGSRYKIFQVIQFSGITFEKLKFTPERGDRPNLIFDHILLQYFDSNGKYISGGPHHTFNPLVYDAGFDLLFLLKKAHLNTFTLYSIYALDMHALYFLDEEWRKYLEHFYEHGRWIELRGLPMHTGNITREAWLEQYLADAELRYYSSDRSMSTAVPSSEFTKVMFPSFDRIISLEYTAERLINGLTHDWSLGGGAALGLISVMPGESLFEEKTRGKRRNLYDGAPLPYRPKVRGKKKNGMEKAYVRRG
jgi:hypothetical protein